MSYSCESEWAGVPRPVSGSGCHREGASEHKHANSPATGSKQARTEESGWSGLCGPASGSGCHREGASEQTHANSPATGSKQART